MKGFIPALMCSSLAAGAMAPPAQAGTETVLHAFGAGQDGAIPSGPLVKVGSAFYGTTTQGGASNAGTVFTIAPSGAEQIIYSFKGGTDAENPTGLINVGGTLYGTSPFGGDTACMPSGRVTVCARS